MQAVRVAAALHNTAGLLINNLNLAIAVYNVLVILLKEGVGLKQLVNSVNTLRFYSVVCHKLIMACKFLFFCKVLVLKLCKLSAYVWKHKETWVAGICGDKVNTLVSKLYAVMLLLNHKEEVICNLRHTLVVLLHVDSLCLEHGSLNSRLAQIFDK